MAFEVSDTALRALIGMGEEAGFGWRRHSLANRSTDEFLNIPIGDGIIPTKIDGWIHATTLTAKSLAKYARDKKTGLDIEALTSWSGGNAAARYARWQVDFHWKIDTRPWQYFLYLYTMKAAFTDAISASDLSEEDKRGLHEVNRCFWEEVVIIYSYRSEVIERARRYAPHPDPTCGSSWQGYPYFKIWDRGDPSFQELSLPFLETGTSEDGRVEGKIEPAPFPVVDGQIYGEVPSAAKLWVREARRIGVCDEWLRVNLGARWVPTRFNGWWASIEQIAGSLDPFAKNACASPGLADHAVRFGLVQAEFFRRLGGEPRQAAALLRSAEGALRELAGPRGWPADRVSAFLRTSLDTIEANQTGEGTLDEDALPELASARPIHPRYAPVDPLEPLPWQVENQDRYKKKMERLGYTL